MKKLKWPQKGLQSFSPLSSLAHLILMTPFKFIYLVRHSFLEPQLWMNPWPFAICCIFTTMNAIGQIAWVAKDAIHFIYNHILVQLVATQLQFCHISFSTTMQLPYDYNYNVLMMSLYIHSSKFNMSHYEDFLVIFFWMIIGLDEFRWS
jgi:hypothetical protein